MRSAFVAALMLCAATGLALAVAPRSARIPGLVALALASTGAVFAPVPSGWTDAVFLGCWIGVAANAATVHLRRGLRARWAVALSLNAGAWAGAVVALAGSRFELLEALPCTLALLATASIAGRRLPITLKVVSSWLIAVALLAAILPFVSVTPGYLPDHLE
ncbi:hypothetical protein [Dokdonella soli]|uniref:GGDEF domain-containing protein n=1 Tax=Dokdonella soli TaxID=529810 RepID=A0ABN1IB97_9GAMM